MKTVSLATGSWSLLILGILVAQEATGQTRPSEEEASGRQAWTLARETELTGPGIGFAAGPPRFRSGKPLRSTDVHEPPRRSETRLALYRAPGTESTPMARPALTRSGRDGREPETPLAGRKPLREREGPLPAEIPLSRSATIRPAWSYSPWIWVLCLAAAASFVIQKEFTGRL